MKNTVRKGFLFLVLVLFVVGGVFAQRVGDTVTVSGQQFRVQEYRDGRMVLQLVPSLDGTWVMGSFVITINGNTAVYTQVGSTNPRSQDAINKGYVSVGGQLFRNLRSTGNLTWSGQELILTGSNSAPNVVTGTRWDNTTITMNADGQSFSTTSGATWTRRQ